jgi:Glyoxalase-like domain
MKISLDHVFVLCETGGSEAEALLSLGFVEGSRNVHPGQGTSNRRFFFDDGFIELLWVSDVTEVTSSLTSPTKLWERWMGRDTGVCPFGIVFSSSETEVPKPPFEVWRYQPEYLPKDKAIYFAAGTHLEEPDLIYLAWPNPQASSKNQPKSHVLPLLRMNRVCVGYPQDVHPSAAFVQAINAGLVQIYASETFELTIYFESSTNVDIDLKQQLGIRLKSDQMGRLNKWQAEN